MKINKLTKNHAEDYLNLKLEALSNNPDAFKLVYEEAILTIDQIRQIIPGDDRKFILGYYEGQYLIGTVEFYQESRTKVRHKAHVSFMYVKP